MNQPAQKENSRAPALFEAHFMSGVHDQYWIAAPGAGEGIDVITVPSYWKHTARFMRVFDKIIVKPRDSAYYAELITLDAQENIGARVDVLLHRPYNQDAAAPALPSKADEYTIRWAGPHDQFQVVRNSDNIVISRNHYPKDAAQRALLDHLSSGLS